MMRAAGKKEVWGFTTRASSWLLGAVAIGALAGCSAVGPSVREVNSAPTKSSVRGIRIVDVNQSVVQDLDQRDTEQDFAHFFAPAQPIGTIVGPGDVLEVSIWEAPPATLFGAAQVESQGASLTQGSRVNVPEYMVPQSGSISVPFAGTVPVTGRTLATIERDIANRLAGKAHMPQVMVRLVKNASANVTVVGEVVNSTRMPLTPKGERLLDALAAAGGTRQPVNKVMIQVSRDDRVLSMPLARVIRDSQENIVLRTGDVVTTFYQPYSFTALGAAGKNAEVEFEATGLTLAQAIGRMGGLQDARADPAGVFLFRWEKPSEFHGQLMGAAQSKSGNIPVIYRINMRDPGAYFAVQNFYIHDKDVIFVTNSPVAEFQRFLNIIASSVFPVAALQSAL